MTTESSLLAIGRIMKAFGIGGEVVVQTMTAVPARFRKLASVLIGPADDRVEEFGVERVSIEPRGVRLKLRGVNDRDAAEHLAGCLLFVDEQHRIKVPRGTFFVHDVVGLAAVDPDGNRIGTVREVLKMPANDVYVIDSNGHEILVPAVKEFILRIDPAAGIVRVKLIEGMLEM